jgi:polysaccharide deacetylase 2 family uncharacterized protein YibQ
MDFLTKQIAKRGLIYINNVVGTNIYKAPEISLPTKTVDLEIKDNLFIESIKNRLERLETLAKYKGVAIAIIEAKPVSMQVINEWAETLINKYEQSSVPQTGAKQFIIAPISALVTE